MEDLTARVQTDIKASTDKVWDALTNPGQIKQYMFGTTVKTKWEEGSPITWSGKWEGKSYEDKGQILAIKENELLEYTHFSPLTREEDKPENYHKVSIRLSDNGNETQVYLTQDGNKTAEAKAHSEQNWGMMLDSMKKLLENPGN